MVKTLDHEIDVLEHQFARNGVQVRQGEARFLGPNRLAIAACDGDRMIEEEVEADKVLIATGTVAGSTVYTVRAPSRSPATRPASRSCRTCTDAVGCAR